MATTSFPRILPGAKTHFPLSSGGLDLWHKSTPASVSRAGDWGDDAAGWRAWRKHLRQRARPVAPDELLHDPTAFLWGWSERGPASPAGLARRIDKLLPTKQTQPELAEELRYWLAEATPQCFGTPLALDSLCWCWRLPRLARRLPANLWWTLLNRLVETSHNAAKLSADDNPVAQQILAGELPLTLAYLFPELQACRKLATGARLALTAGLEGLVDPEGLVHGQHWNELGLLLATWTRARTVGGKFRHASWDAGAQARYRELVVQTLRGARADGTVALGPASTEAWPAPFWQAALTASESALTRRLASAVLPRRLRAGPKEGALKSKTLPEAAAQSDPSCMALLRTRWRRTSDLLAVDSSGSVIKTEFSTAGKLLFSGSWGLDVQIGDEPLVPVSPWESVCWVTDEDVVYFELEMAFAKGVRIQRQMMLARRDRFLLLADAVLSRQPAPVHYRSWLPLAGAVAVQPTDDTRELLLRLPGRDVLAIPCALNEWRSGTPRGSLEVREQGLVLEQTAPQGNLFAPLFFHLGAPDKPDSITWRSLTVAENREIQPPDVAVGYRVRVGDRQWLIYRAMAERAGRTVLGANSWSQFLASRIKRSGELATLLEIE